MASPIDGHKFEQAPGDGEGQGDLVCCSPWGCKELDTTERLNNNSFVSELSPFPLFQSITFLASLSPYSLRKQLNIIPLSYMVPVFIFNS